MGNRLSKIYTRKGDKGDTGLAANHRVDKDSSIIEAIGTIDELNANIGVLTAYRMPDQILDKLLMIQHELFDIGAELAMPEYNSVDQGSITSLEESIDAWNDKLPPLKEFILPGGTIVVAHCHLARTVCRRAERTLVSANRERPLRDEVLAYINRLSDFLFVLARTVASIEGQQDIYWQNKSNR